MEKRGTKWYSLFLLLLVLLAVQPLLFRSVDSISEERPAEPERAEEAVVEETAVEWIYEPLPDGTAVISGCSGSAGRLEVPGSIDGHEISAIGDNAFAGRSDIAEVTLPASLYRIDAGAFEGCDSLAAINLESVSVLGRRAFADCPLLREVVFSEELTEINEETFSGCVSLCSPEFPQSLNRIGEKAFFGCYSLETVALGGVSVEQSAFADCLRLRSFSLGEGAEELARYALGGCTELREVTLPSTLTHIRDGAFMYCSALERVEIPGTVLSIERDAFSGCPALTIAAPKTSAAYRYSISHGIAFEAADA